MEVLSVHAHKLLDGIVSHINKTENIERRNGGEAMPEIQDLKKDLIRDKKIAQQMIKGIRDAMELNLEKRREFEEKIRILEENAAHDQKRIVRLEGEIFKLDERVDELNEKVQEQEIKLAATQNDLAETRNDHERTKNTLKELESSLQTGQIAFDFEKDLATYIYPEDKRIGSRQIFTNMKKWLEEENNTPRGLEANAKWNELQREFSWSSEHEKVIFKLLEFRRKFAHPPVDRDAVKSQIPDAFTYEEKRRINDLIDMIERVNELMQ